MGRLIVSLLVLISTVVALLSGVYFLYQMVANAFAQNWPLVLVSVVALFAVPRLIVILISIPLMVTYKAVWGDN